VYCRPTLLLGALAKAFILHALALNTTFKCMLILFSDVMRNVTKQVLVERPAQQMHPCRRCPVAIEIYKGARVGQYQGHPSAGGPANRSRPRPGYKTLAIGRRRGDGATAAKSERALHAACVRACT